jgi:hypothetical protein
MAIGFPIFEAAAAARLQAWSFVFLLSQQQLLLL